jgi:hypothetical protein
MIEPNDSDGLFLTGKLRECRTEVFGDKCLDVVAIP